MKKKKEALVSKIFVAILTFILFSVFYSFADETITLTTYYPAPYGVYKEMRANRMAIGEDYRYVDLADDTLIVSGKVGIGTASPQTDFDIGIGEPTIRLSNRDETASGGDSRVWGDHAGGWIEWRDSAGARGGWIGYGGGFDQHYYTTNELLDKDIRFKTKSSDGTKIRMTIASNGNVGIGTVSPVQKFQVNDTATSAFVVTSAGQVGIGTSSPQDNLHIYDSGDPAIVYDTGSDINWYTGVDDSDSDRFKICTGTGIGLSNAKVIITSDGKVGIGARALGPLTGLHITGTKISSFTGSSSGILRIDGDSHDGDYIPIDFSHDAGYVKPTARIAAYYGAGGSKLMFGTSNSFTSGITNTAVTIDYKGNVGIGTTNPSSVLHVKSSTSDRVIFETKNGKIHLAAYGTVAGAYKNAGALYVVDADVEIMTGLNNYGDIKFVLKSNNMWVERMRIINNGNVGIGMASPEEKLHVAGDLKVDGNFVNIYTGIFTCGGSWCQKYYGGGHNNPHDCTWFTVSDLPNGIKNILNIEITACQYEEHGWFNHDSCYVSHNTLTTDKKVRLCLDHARCTGSDTCTDGYRYKLKITYIK